MTSHPPSPATLAQGRCRFPKRTGGGHLSRTARSSWRRRAGSAITSISTIFPCVVLNARTKDSRPRGATMIPTSPLTSAGFANRARRVKAGACLATAGAPRTSLGAPRGSASRSARRKTSGSRTPSSASKSPPREAARKASTTSRCREGSASRGPPAGGAPGDVHGPQADPVGLELLCKPFVLLHRSHSLVAIRHSGDERSQADVTNLDVRHYGSAEEETNHAGDIPIPTGTGERSVRRNSETWNEIAVAQRIVHCIACRRAAK